MLVQSGGWDHRLPVRLAFLDELESDEKSVRDLERENDIAVRALVLVERPVGRQEHAAELGRGLDLVLEVGGAVERDPESGEWRPTPDGKFYYEDI